MLTTSVTSVAHEGWGLALQIGFLYYKFFGHILRKNRDPSYMLTPSATSVAHEGKGLPLKPCFSYYKVWDTSPVKLAPLLYADHNSR